MCIRDRCRLVPKLTDCYVGRYCNTLGKRWNGRTKLRLRFLPGYWLILIWIEQRYAVCWCQIFDTSSPHRTRISHETDVLYARNGQSSSSKRTYHSWVVHISELAQWTRSLVQFIEPPFSKICIVIKRYKYLDVKITASGKQDKEIRSGINLIKMAISTLNRILWDK